MNEKRDNSGALFPVEQKKQDNHADFEGSITVNGQEFWINGWKKVGRDSGKKFLSLSVKPKGQRPTHGQQQPAKSQPSSDDGDW
jgi:uncharacterized protein (DUF736 family)